MFRTRVFAVVACALLGLASSARAATTVSGTVAGNTVWTPAGNPYIVSGDLVVPAGSTLTLQAGTQVFVSPGDDQQAGVDPVRVEIVIHGSLVVSGTALSPVNFSVQSPDGS